MSGETVYMQGLGGAVFEMTLPLQPAILKQFDAGDLLRVNADGSQYESQVLPGDEDEGQAPPAVPTAPAGKASK